MRNTVAKDLYCGKCKRITRHVPSGEFHRLYRCVDCRTLTKDTDPPHTHIHGVTPPVNTHGYKWHDRVVRQKPEEKREGERE